MKVALRSLVEIKSGYSPSTFELTESGTIPYIKVEHIKTLSKVYLAFEDVERLAAIVSTDDITAKNYNLNIPSYVKFSKAEQIDVAMEVGRLMELVAERDAAEERMTQHLQELGYVE